MFSYHSDNEKRRGVSSGHCDGNMKKNTGRKRPNSKVLAMQSPRAIAAYEYEWEHKLYGTWHPFWYKRLMVQVP